MEFANDFYNECLKSSKADCYNLVCHRHIGDAVYFAALKDLFETKYKSNLHYLIKPSQEFIFKMYGIENYTVIDMASFILKNKVVIERFHSLNKNDCLAKDVDGLEYYAFLSSFSAIPQKGVPFICDSLLNDMLNEKNNNFYCNIWQLALGLKETKIKAPQNYPQLTESIKKTIMDISPLNKIILIAPEAQTTGEFDREFWQILINNFTAKGYVIFVNSKQEKYKFKNTYNVYDYNLDLEDVVALGYACAYVFSVRSGLCDVLVGKQDKLYAIYPGSFAKELYSLRILFKLKPNPIEILIKDFYIEGFDWENISFDEVLNKFLRKKRYERLKYGILSNICFWNKNDRINAKNKKKKLKKAYRCSREYLKCQNQFDLHEGVTE